MFVVHQVVPSRTQALVANFQVLADVRAATVVVQTLIGACRGRIILRIIIYTLLLHLHYLDKGCN